MTQEWSLPGWAFVAAGGLVVVLFLATLAIVRSLRRRVEEQAEVDRATTLALRKRLAGLEERLERSPSPRSSPSSTTDEIDPSGGRADYVITRMGEERDHEGAPPSLPPSLFADLVLREGVVRAAGLAAGLRHALAPETRNRIRFAMRQEVKRSRKQRRAEVRLARREWQERQRPPGRESAA